MPSLIHNFKMNWRISLCNTHGGMKSDCGKMARSVAIYSLLISLAFRPAAFAAEPITVFAAASLKDVMEDIGQAYSAAGGSVVQFSFAGSSLLAKQIEGGNHADLFASADLNWMDYLSEKKLVKPATQVNLLSNRLVVVAPRTAALTMLDLSASNLSSALGEGRLVTGDVNSVPVGVYAKSALQKIDLWQTVEPKLAQAENARAALAFVVRGEAPLGIVYLTDALAEKGVKIVAMFPESSHEPILYPFAITASSKNPESVKLLNFIQGDSAKTIFEHAGFIVLASAQNGRPLKSNLP